MKKDATNLLKSLFVLGDEQTYVKGEIIPANGQIHYLESGFVAIIEQLATGKKKMLFIYRPGEIFPFLYQEIYSISNQRLSYMALDTVKIKTLTTDVFEEQVVARPQNTQAVLRQHADILQLALERIGHLGNADTMTRLAARLVFSAKRFGRRENDKTIILVPLTHGEIALAIGTSRETVNRLMRKLEKERIIEMRDRHVVVMAMERLSQLGQADE